MRFPFILCEHAHRAHATQHRTSRKHLRHRLCSRCRNGPEISISSSDESKAEKEEDHVVQERYVTKILLKGWKERASWTGGTRDKTARGDSQSSQEQWNEDRKKKESKWTEMTKVFPETGVFTRARKKHLGTKAAKKRQKGKEYLVIQTAELKCQVNVDRRTKTELQDRRLQKEQGEREGREGGFWHVSLLSNKCFDVNSLYHNIHFHVLFFRHVLRR